MPCSRMTAVHSRWLHRDPRPSHCTDAGQNAVRKNRIANYAPRQRGAWKQCWQPGPEAPSLPIGKSQRSHASPPRSTPPHGSLPQMAAPRCP
eukprot:2628726-Rhodomonas_salina.1